MSELGSLSILNTGAGDIKMTFDHHNPDEATKAIAMLQDIQKRGYAILVQQEDGSYARAHRIDAETGCYVVVVPTPISAPVPAPAEEPGEDTQGEVSATPEPQDEDTLAPNRKARRSRGTVKNIPVAGAKAVAVARSAGG